MMLDHSSTLWHEPVLVSEVIQFLKLTPGLTVVDGTVGTGGHSLAVLPHLLPDGRLVAIDQDPQALAWAQRRLSEFASRTMFLHGNFRDLPSLLKRTNGILVDRLLLDIGMSSLQVDDATRGFSFLKDGPLDMRMDPSQDLTAEEVVRTASAEALAIILVRFGEERFARRIARRIVETRREAPLTTTTQLARLVVSAVPAGARHGRVHPATRTFQALRIAVNGELEALETFLANLPALLRPGGRALVLTFHSLEDRLVKQAFIAGQRDGQWTVLTKKPVRPQAAEVARNPRARSAKLRAIERN